MCKYSDQEDTEVSIGTEIPVLDSCDEIKAQDNFTLYSLSHEEPSTSSNDLDFNLEYGNILISAIWLFLLCFIVEL